MNYNENISALEPSRSVTLLAKTKERMKTDDEIINLTGGEPDFPTPKPICDEVTRQLAAGNTHYSDSRGNESLRIRIAKKLAKENDAPYTKDQILVTPGGKMAVYLAVRALVNPGDEVIWLAPGWVSYPSIVEASGGVPVAVHLNYDENYRITRRALEAAASDRTKLLIINYPNNPTGRILTESDIEELSAFLRVHPTVHLLSDEIYEKIIYDGKRAVSMASFPEFFDRVIVVNGFSKCSAMTGWRVGYLACSKELYEMVWKLFQHCMSCTSVFLQEGARVALDCPEETERMRAAYEHRRDLLVEGIRSIPGVELISPDGAFYAWTRFDTGMDAETLCEKLLETAKIAGIPGSAYGEEDAVCVRFSFAAPEEDLKEMLLRLKIFAETVLKK
ncbi:MAG: pyridoxal phosphate-dependent aminotransferase [Lachnospiraceae bacterium]|nr:pyridoxal phosphate-dependent aminotransferase [Lachnospiraceae bacterium]